MDEYLVEKGMKRNPRLNSGYFYGKESWLNEMREKLREKMHELYMKPDKFHPIPVFNSWVC
jgi:hypothetical protein